MKIPHYVNQAFTQPVEDNILSLREVTTHIIAFIVIGKHKVAITITFV